MYEYIRRITKFYKKHGRYDVNPFINANFLMEEVGEVFKAIRIIEVG